MLRSVGLNAALERTLYSIDSHHTHNNSTKPFHQVKMYENTTKFNKIFKPILIKNHVDP